MYIDYFEQKSYSAFMSWYIIHKQVYRLRYLHHKVRIWRNPPQAQPSAEQQDDPRWGQIQGNSTVRRKASGQDNQKAAFR